MSVSDDVGVGAQRHEQDRRDRGPHDLDLRVAVDRRAVLEPPRPGACGSARRSSRRPPRPARRPAPRRSAGRPQRVDPLRLPWPPRAGTSRSTARPRCRRSTATAPIAIISAKSPCVSRLATSSLCGVVSSALVAPAQTTTQPPRDPWRPHPRGHPRQRSRPGHAGTPPPSGGRRSDPCASGGDRRGVPAERPRHARGPVGGRRDAVMAAERLRELGRLSIADPCATSRTVRLREDSISAARSMRTAVR